jgi:hypothetical protein
MKRWEYDTEPDGTGMHVVYGYWDDEGWWPVNNWMVTNMNEHEKPYGEIMDEMDHEAKYLPAENILQDILVTMKHARVFITSREKMHPTGVQLYDELLEKLSGRLPMRKQANDL